MMMNSHSMLEQLSFVMERRKRRDSAMFNEGAIFDKK